MDEGRGECLLQQDLPPFEQAMDSDPSNSLEAFEHLAFLAASMGKKWLDAERATRFITRSSP